MTTTTDLSGPKTQLVLRYLKHRWLRDTRDLLEEGRFDDLDLDNDMVELERAAGIEAVARVAQGLLERREPPSDDDPALAALRPELEGEAARAFLRLVAVNLAFRLRTDALLAALLAAEAEGPGPKLGPERMAALLTRARSVAAARSLVEASPASGAAREEVLAALAPPELQVAGARIHAEAPHDLLEPAVEAAFPDLEPVVFHEAAPGMRRFVLLRKRGGFTTLLEEGEGPTPELARHLAKTKGCGRVIWARLPADDDEGADADLLVLEQTRTLLDRAGLMRRLGREPTADDVAGELRALGVLDYDPEHPRGRAELDFAAHARARRKGIRGFALGKAF